TQTTLDARADQTNTYTKRRASAPESLNALNELAQALANDPNRATTVFNQLATKATTAYVVGQPVLKANQSNTYTVDNALAGKQTSITSSTALGLASITATGSVTARWFYIHKVRCYRVW
ncbi:MAG: hypothetical protein ACKPKO_15875, partial [Candidatus Fonsibacter sp.]